MPLCSLLHRRMANPTNGAPRLLKRDACETCHPQWRCGRPSCRPQACVSPNAFLKFWMCLQLPSYLILGPTSLNQPPFLKRKSSLSISTVMYHRTPNTRAALIRVASQGASPQVQFCILSAGIGWFYPLNWHCYRAIGVENSPTPCQVRRLGIWWAKVCIWHAWEPWFGVCALPKGWSDGSPKMTDWLGDFVFHRMPNSTAWLARQYLT